VIPPPISEANSEPSADFSKNLLELLKPLKEELNLLEQDLSESRKQSAQAKAQSTLALEELGQSREELKLLRLDSTEAHSELLNAKVHLQKVTTEASQLRIERELLKQDLKKSKEALNQAEIKNINLEEMVMKKIDKPKAVSAALITGSRLTYGGLRFTGKDWGAGLYKSLRGDGDDYMIEASTILFRW
jgi:Chromosome segregation ATPases